MDTYNQEKLNFQSFDTLFFIAYRIVLYCNWCSVGIQSTVIWTWKRPLFINGLKLDMLLCFAQRISKNINNRIFTNFFLIPYYLLKIRFANQYYSIIIMVCRYIDHLLDWNVKFDNAYPNEIISIKHPLILIYENNISYCTFLWCIDLSQLVVQINRPSGGKN